MDSSCGNRDNVKCTLCRRDVASMYCNVCITYLCKNCVEKHLFDKTKEHSVVSSTQSISTFPMCSKHPTKRCELQCEQCDNLICTLCVASKIHKHHDVNDLAIFYENKLADLKLDIQEFENSIYPKYQETMSDIPARKAEMIEHSQALKANLKKQGRLLHREIDTIMEKMQSEIDDMDAQNIAAIEKHKGVINSTINEICKVIQDLKKLLDSNDVSFISKYKSRNEKFRKLPPKLAVSSLKFEPRIIHSDKLRELFGFISPSDREFLSVPFIEANVITDPTNSTSVSCQSNEGFWTICSDNSIKVQTVGRSICTKTGKRPADIALTRYGDIVYTDLSDRSINIVTNSMTQLLVRLKEWLPFYVCSTSSGDLLVTMSSGRYERRNKIVRYNGSNEKQSIQWDEKWGQFTDSGIGKLIENRNLDICVVDGSAGKVVVLNTDGKLRFRYSGRSVHKDKQFMPIEITTDSLGRILALDFASKSIHILDQDGNFLRFIDNCSLENPSSICVDSNDNIFVSDVNRVKKIQYYK